MRVSEVRPGMRGYGLTVFQGTKVERFDVEVLSVLKNFNPRSDVVLVRCWGDDLEHTGAIAGMSGSPVFLKDDSGRERMIGAFAYGWPLTKDPVGGVQPIEYMLAMPGNEGHDEVGDKAAAEGPATAGPSTQSAGAGLPAAADNEGADGRTAWSLKDAGLLPLRGARGVRAADGPAPLRSGAVGLLGGADGVPRLQPLATPLMVSGMSPSLLRQWGPALGAVGLTPLQAGGTGGSAPPDHVPAALEPGGVLAVPLLTGDSEMTAIGTVTEVLGGRVFGFGHPFNNEGRIDLPMGSGYISGVIANLQTSFKLGSLSRAQGTLTIDDSVGVAGHTGAVPPSIPIEFTVSAADGSAPRTYHFQSALHPKFTPLLAGMAFGAALTGSSELPQYNTVDYDLKLEFADGQTLRVADRAVNTSAGELFGGIGLPLQAAAENPFQRVMVRRISGTIRVSPEARAAQILEVNLPRSKYRPGELVRAFVTYKPFRGPEATLPVEMELPRDLPKGTYQLTISDAQRYFQDEQATRPFRFTAEKVQDVFTVLRDVASIRENALYLRLLRQPDGVALGRTAMPELPSSMRQVMMGAGRSTTTAFVSSTVRTVPTDVVMSGSAEFALTIDANAKVAVGGAGGAGKPARSEAAPPAGKPEEPRPKPVAVPKNEEQGREGTTGEK